LSIHPLSEFAQVYLPRLFAHVLNLPRSYAHVLDPPAFCSHRFPDWSTRLIHFPTERALATSRFTNPLPLRLISTTDADSFITLPHGTTGLPLPPHPGAFGAPRSEHVHGGVDLYCAEGTPVVAMEAGEVVAVLPVTGPHAGKPWWLNTWMIMIEGDSGVLAYGGLRPAVSAGESLAPGEHLGQILSMVRFAGGRPTSLLHLELYAAGTRAPLVWADVEQRPDAMLDPTPLLLAIAGPS
jgi:murein DD-endopeptidase MepM/ murein hydrolase activator NlpD